MIFLGFELIPKPNQWQITFQNLRRWELFLQLLLGHATLSTFLFFLWVFADSWEKLPSFQVLVYATFKLLQTSIYCIISFIPYLNPIPHFSIKNLKIETKSLKVSLLSPHWVSISPNFQYVFTWVAWGKIISITVIFLALCKIPNPFYYFKII